MENKQKLNIKIFKNKYICISDLHLFHNWIFIYEYEKRKEFITFKNNFQKDEIIEILKKKKELITKEDRKLINNSIDELKTNKKLIDFLIKEINNFIKKNQNHKNLYFLFLWDIFFHFWEMKFKFLDEIWFNELIELIKSNFKDIYLILWNHENIKNKHFEHYKKFFKEENILFYLKDWNYLFTHYPLWQSIIYNLLWQTDYKIYWKFLENDKKLFKELTEKYKRIYNIHWHTHSFQVNFIEQIKKIKDNINRKQKKELLENFKKIKYHNICFDNIIHS